MIDRVMDVDIIYLLLVIKFNTIFLQLNKVSEGNNY
jgi:hypothetical protein